MERLFKPYDKEHMRLAMLKHEETFRQQVYELHRLYGIQKMLMKSTISDHRDGIGSDQIHHHQKQRFKVDLERPAGDYIAESVEESEIELTLGLGLGPSSHNNPRKETEIITPIHSDCGPSSFSSSSTGSSHIVNTTSSGTHQLDQKLNQPPWLFQVLSLNMTS